VVDFGVEVYDNVGIGGVKRSIEVLGVAVRQSGVCDVAVLHMLVFDGRRLIFFFFTDYH
jgi:hypothetical protein